MGPATALGCGVVGPGVALGCGVSVRGAAVPVQGDPLNHARSCLQTGESTASVNAGQYQVGQTGFDHRFFPQQRFGDASSYAGALLRNSSLNIQHASLCAFDVRHLTDDFNRPLFPTHVFHT